MKAKWNIGCEWVVIKFIDVASCDDLDPTFLSLCFVTLSALVFWAVQTANSQKGHSIKYFKNVDSRLELMISLNTKWLLYGDLNTRYYYHLKTITRCRKKKKSHFV